MQKAKAYPGRRTAAVKARADRMARVAALLAPSVVVNEIKGPAFLYGPGFEAALAMWRRLTPELKRTHRLPVDSHEVFATYCCTYVEWLEAQIDINEGGRTQTVKTVAGGSMERDRPAMRHRQQAFDNLLKLSERFGFTPRDLYDLYKDIQAAAVNNPSLFDDQTEGGQPLKSVDNADMPAPTHSMVGSAQRFRSQPPVQ